MTTDATPVVIPDVLSFRLDGQGGAEAVSPDEAIAFGRAGGEAGFVWLHMRRDHPETRGRLDALGLDPVTIEALVANETRPRCTVVGDGALLNLRGVNLNPGAEPEDMVSVRLWLDGARVVGIWLRPLRAVGDMVASIERGLGPLSPGDLAAKLALRLADRAEPSIGALNERVDAMEETVLDDQLDVEPTALSEVRRSAIMLRRYMVPQRDALTTLEIEDLDWLTSRDRTRLREAAEWVYRLGEELDSIRDRAQVVHDQIMNRRAEMMNRQMLVLSIAAAIFLPLGLITGLLGINVGGIPGAESPWAFAIVCAALVVIAGGLLWWFRKLGMFR